MGTAKEEICVAVPTVMARMGSNNLSHTAKRRINCRSSTIILVSQNPWQKTIHSMLLLYIYFICTACKTLFPVIFVAHLILPSMRPYRATSSARVTLVFIISLLPDGTIMTQSLRPILHHWSSVLNWLTLSNTGHNGTGNRLPQYR